MSIAIHPFDLQQRAAAAARSLPALVDDTRDGLLYFLASWQAKPPAPSHCLWDYGDGCGRHVDALTLVRRMLPSGMPETAPCAAEMRLEAWMHRQLVQ